MHDGWIRKSDHRYRIAQKGTEWLKVIQKLLSNLGYRSWIYREGKARDVHVLESVAPIFREKFHAKYLVAAEERSAYIRGFFDAEGGIPRSLASNRYIQLVQKDKQKIIMLKDWLTDLDIASGKIHNPSKRVDPNYWRIFVSRHSISDFVSKIGSWHPRKADIFDEWMKI
jgi:intein/homing endonuclease